MASLAQRCREHPVVMNGALESQLDVRYGHRQELYCGDMLVIPAQGWVVLPPISNHRVTVYTYSILQSRRSLRRPLDTFAGSDSSFCRFAESVYESRRGKDSVAFSVKLSVREPSPGTSSPRICSSARLASRPAVFSTPLPPTKRSDSASRRSATAGDVTSAAAPYLFVRLFVR